jgi:hypothetical protein
MSGSLSLIREVHTLYSGTSPTRSFFWSCVWMAFALSAFFAWWQEHSDVQIERQAKEYAEKDLANASPKLFLEYSEEHAAHFTTYSGLFVRNCGKQQAFKVELSSGYIDGIGLYFEDLPIQHIDPEKRYPIDLRTGRQLDGIFRYTGGGLGAQLESLFDHLLAKNKDELFPVMVKYRDHEGKEFVTPCMIKRQGLPGHKRIWCELA